MSIIEKKTLETPSTPPEGYVHWYVNADGRPEYVDEDNDIHTFHGPAGPPGPVGGMQWKGFWDGDKTYDSNDVVNHGGCLHIATASTATEPGTSQDWELMLGSPASEPAKARTPRKRTSTN